MREEDGNGRGAEGKSVLDLTANESGGKEARRRKSGEEMLSDLIVMMDVHGYS